MKNKRIMVAGIGNRLRGDDGFGPRVIDLLENMDTPKNVDVRDMGTAGITIATDLEDYEIVVFIDLVNEKGDPGQLVKRRLEVKGDLKDLHEIARLTLHEAGLEGLITFSKAIGTLPEKVYLIGCIPEKIDFSTELSENVEKSLNEATKMVFDILKKEKI